MTDAQIERCRKRMDQFLTDLVEPMGRSERRHWAAVYVRGLLLDGERKSIEPLAARLPDGNAQALQQFIGQSPWEWDAVWERLGKRMTAELEPDAAWVVDDTGFPKQGSHSVGVSRQYSGTLGKTGNCQVAVSVHHVGEEGNAPLGWRLYLPESWAKLEQRQLRYIVGVAPQVGVWLERPQPTLLKPMRTGRPPSALHYGEQRPLSAKAVAQQAKGWKTIVWREGSRGRMKSRFWAGRVQPSHGFHEGRPPLKEVWLLVEWPESDQEPIKYFFCDLPADYSLRRLVRLAKCRWKIKQDYQQLKEELGLDHYEGRSWQGLHHHVTLVMMAHAFLTLEALRSKKNFWVDPAEDAS